MSIIESLPAGYSAHSAGQLSFRCRDICQNTASSLPPKRRNQKIFCCILNSSYTCNAVPVVPLPDVSAGDESGFFLFLPVRRHFQLRIYEFCDQTGMSAGRNLMEWKSRRRDMPQLLEPSLSDGASAEEEGLDGFVLVAA